MDSLKNSSVILDRKELNQIWSGAAQNLSTTALIGKQTKIYTRHLYYSQNEMEGKLFYVFVDSQKHSLFLCCSSLWITFITVQDK